MTRLPLKRRKEVAQRFLKGESVNAVASHYYYRANPWQPLADHLFLVEDAIRCEARRYQGQKPLRWVP